MIALPRPRSRSKDAEVKTQSASRGASIRRDRSQWIGALAVTLGGLALTILAFLLCLRAEQNRVQLELSRRSGSLATALRQRIEAESAGVLSLAAFVGAQRSAGPTELLRFIEGESAISTASVRLGWAPRIDESARSSFEESMSLDLGSPWTIINATGDASQDADSTNDRYFPLLARLRLGTDLEVLAAGTDLLSLRALRMTLDSARHRGALTLSPPLDLANVGEGSSPSSRRSGDPASDAAAETNSNPTWIAAVAPVFHNRAISPTGTATPSEIAGYALGLWPSAELIATTFSDLDAGSLGVRLVDGAAPAGQRSVWSQEAATASTTGSILILLWETLHPLAERWSSSFEIAGRRWSVLTYSGPRLLESTLSWTPWIVAVSGFLLSLLAASAFDLLRTQNRKVTVLGSRLQRERRDQRERESRLGDRLETEKDDRRRAEEGVFREKQQFRLMFNAVPAMIWYKDTKNRFLLVNENAARSMGRSVEELEGKPCSELFPSTAYETYRDDLEIIQSGKPKLGIIEELQDKDGNTVCVRTDKVPEYDAMGRVVGILIFAQDITEQRGAEDEVRRLNAQLEQRLEKGNENLARAHQDMESFAYSVSHGLRTPLRSIDGFSQMLMEDHAAELTGDAQTLLHRVRDSSQKMGSLVDDLLTLTRANRAALTKEKVDLTAVAENVASDLAAQGPRRPHAEFIISDTPLVQGDPKLLRTVLENLLGNAWKFTAGEPAPRIEFGYGRVATPQGETVEAYHVTDNGIGFDMAYSDRIFDAFQRLHGPTEFEGSGIGLATAARIIQRHGGMIWVKSEPEEGATFYFTLQELNKGPING